MGFADIWNRTLVYFGIAEEDDWDEDGYVTEEQFDDWTDPGDEAPPQRRPRLRGIDTASVQVHLVVPRSFNDAQQIADRFKQGIPVILNLQSADQELSKRLIDFASGLTYALEGGMQRVADKVFLLTPQNVQ